MNKHERKRDAIQAEMDKLARKLDKTVLQVRIRCDHKDVIEVPFKSGYFSCSPHRVCAECGLQEKGWYNQYISVLAPTREAGFDQAMAVRDHLARYTSVSSHVGDDV